MQKIVNYHVVECCNIKEYLDNGWRPWGDAIMKWNGLRETPYQPMVFYEDIKT